MGGTAKLYCHPESDSLFWSDEWPEDGLCEEVSHMKRYRDAARERGIDEPLNAIGYDKTGDPDFFAAKDMVIDAEVTSGSGMAYAITSSYKKWERKPADLYPTPVDGTESLIAALKVMKRPDGKPVKRIWEPACGDGRLARVLEWHGFEVISTDLREYPGYGTGGIDFLKHNPLEDFGWDMGEIDAIVTNPPFSVAEDFIRHALTITPNVVMLLKQTYWNVIRRLPLWEEHMPDLELKLTWRLAFLKNERGNSPLMDCMWVVWCGDNAKREPKLRMCVAEPLKKKIYPGYGGIGILPGMEVLEGEMLELGDAIADLVKRLKR